MVVCYPLLNGLLVALRIHENQKAMKAQVDSAVTSLTYNIFLRKEEKRVLKVVGSSTVGLANIAKPFGTRSLYTVH